MEPSAGPIRPASPADLSSSHAANPSICARQLRAGARPCYTRLADRPARHSRGAAVCAATAALLLLSSRGTEPVRAATSALFAAAPAAPTISLAAALFPDAVPGYGQELGLTLPAVIAIGPAQQGLGLRDGPMLLLPALGVETVYDSNVLGYRGSAGSAIVHTMPSLSVDGDWARTRAGLYLGVDDSRYISLPSQSHTDVKLAAGGSAAVGRGDITASYSHLALHEDPASIGSIPSTSPTPFSVDDLRATLNLVAGRATLSPFIDLSRWTYGSASLGTQRIDQGARDRDVLQAGLAARFMLAERRDLLASVSINRNDYLRPPLGGVRPSSTDALALGGVEYDVDGVVRLRVLAGLQARSFDSSLYRDRVTAVGQAAVFWVPRRTTTATLTLARSLEDLAQEDTGGTIFSRVEIGVAHDLRRDVILRARLGLQVAEFLQAQGSQAEAYCIAGADWQVDRHIKVTGSIELQRNSAPALTGAVPVSGPYTRAIGRVGVVVGL